MVTTFDYDDAGRMIERVTGVAIDANILDGNADDTIITDVNLKVVTTYAYLGGSDSLVTEVVTNGAKRETLYDFKNRVEEQKVHARNGKVLVSKKGYEENELLYDEDPYGRRTYYGYRASDGTLIRTITCTVPEQSFSNFAAVWNQTRDSNPNAKFVIHDAIRDADGNLTEVIDGRGTETRYEYDDAGREVAKTEAYGTSIAVRTETDYDATGNVTEVRSPRYFDSGDTLGYQKAKETWAYTGRNLVASHTEAPGTTETATESYAYDLGGRQTTHTDFAGKVWTTIYDDCCGHVTASKNPLGHGSITRQDDAGRTVHQATVETVDDHLLTMANPVDGKTLREVTTKYDSLGRPVARTTWLGAVARWTLPTRRSRVWAVCLLPMVLPSSSCTTII